MSQELADRVMRAMLKSTDFLQVHHHIDGRCNKSYAFKDENDVYQHVVTGDRGEILALEPIPSLAAWARGRIENHAFTVASENLLNSGRA